jgi:fatty aldehyde-generating acyl-ACP reductase
VDRSPARLSSAGAFVDRCPATVRFALIGHLDSWEKTAAVVQSLRGGLRSPISVRDVREIVPFLPPRTVCRVTVFSTDGSCAHGVYVDAFLSPERLGEGFVRENIRRVREAASYAHREGASVAALGGFSSIVLEGRVDLLPSHDEVAFTTGNTLTVAYIVKAVEQASTLAGRPLSSQTVLILGATGDVGSGCARYLLGRAGRLLLCARNPHRLRRLQQSLVSDASDAPPVSISTEPEEFLSEADVIVAAASLAAPRFSLRSVRSDAIVCDAGYPKNVLSDGTPGPVVFFGGMGQVLGGLQLAPDLISVLAPHPAPNIVQGCLLEGMLLALEGRSESYSRGRGNIQPSQVDEIWGLAEKHGFALAPFFNDQGLCGDRIAALRAERVNEGDSVKPLDAELWDSDSRICLHQEVRLTGVR